ncbi:zinc ribbon domain-containing protein [Arthrobacter zhangbolii]|uniref:Zinc ribbon domain-containing protein n=2 Tax=Arthrobacter zhangbolii TaxID=2886936 RepID=A0ABY4DT09_9MICC|nr:zinc ribbon domain-containing protein [Arthrobacter zhangbolii]UON92809.1 zinc ribbon domain-containing protein [Arthrobacter zhangbolii]
MKFCPECGKQQEPGGRFCPECGFAMGTDASAAPSGAHAPATASPAASPAAAPERQPEFAAAGHPGQGMSQQHQDQHLGQGQPYSGTPAPGNSPYGQAQAPAQPAQKRPSAFAGVPVSDYVRDGIAVLLLFFSLFMTWTFGSGSYYGAESTAGTRLDVLLITLLSIFSVGVSYLWRAGVFGPKIGYRQVQDIKALANLPYLILVVVYLVMSMAAAGSFDSSLSILDAAPAFGLAGAIMAAQPRRGEIAPGTVDAPRNRRWVFVTMGIAGLAAVTVLAQIIIRIVEVAGRGDDPIYQSLGLGNPWIPTLLLSLVGLVSVAVLALVALNVFRGSDTWRFTGVCIGVGALFLGLISLMGAYGVSLDYYAGSPSFSLIFWMAFGAAVSAPSVARLTQHTQAAPADRRTALKPAILLTLILTSALAALSLFSMVWTLVEDYDGAATWAISFVFALVMVAGAVMLPKVAARDQRSAYVMGSAYAAILFVLGLVLMIIRIVRNDGSANEVGTGSTATIIMVLTWVMPFVILAVLWLDKAAREHFRTLAPTGGVGAGFTFDAAPQQQAPGHNAPVQHVPGQPVQQTPVQHAPVQPAPASASQAAPAASAAGQGAGVEAPAAGSPVAGTGSTADESVQPAAAGTAPEAESAAEAGTAADPDAALIAGAADPATALARLQELATHPRARVAVAGNPSTYPDLLNWLGQLGDPAVDEALRRRQ